jgi:hypothetical protein
MAETNFTQRIAHCVEMANEISEENSRKYSLASVLTEQLDVGTTARGVAEVLEDRLTECDQMLRLVSTLEAIHDEYTSPTLENTGATTITEALRKIPQAVASDSAQAGEEYFARREAAITALLAAAGPMPPKAIGAFRALAEFIVGGEQDGGSYNLESWVPEAAMSQAERAEYRDRIFAIDAQ